MRHASLENVGIFLVAESRLLREALTRVLSSEADFNVVGTCAPSPNAEYEVLSSRADVVLLDDFGTGHGDLSILTRLLEAAPSLRVVLIGAPESERAFLDSVRAGAVGYVPHEASAEILVSSVRAVLKGEAACPPQMIVSLFKYDAGRGIAQPNFTHETK